MGVNDVEDLTYYMCTDALREDVNVMQLIQLAHYYQMSGLVGKCKELMMDNVTVYTFVDTLKLCSKYEMENSQRLVDFAREHIVALKARTDYCQLPFFLRGFISQAIQ